MRDLHDYEGATRPLRIKQTMVDLIDVNQHKDIILEG